MLPYLLLCREVSTHREHDLRAVFTAFATLRGRGTSGDSCRTIIRPGLQFFSRYSVGYEPGVSSGWSKSAHSAARVCRTQRPANGGVHRQPYAAIHARERRAGRLRRAKRSKGIEGSHRRRHAGHLLALRVTTADQGDRAQIETLAEDMQTVTGGTVEMAYVN